MKTLKRSYKLATVFAAVLAIVISVAGCAATSTSKSTGEMVDDSVLTTKVNAALASDSVASALAVDVEAYRGRVLLSGFVDSEEQIQTIVSIVEGVDGVEEVTNSLQVKPAS
jgi:osmotically-inducible protein OsmY